MSWSRVRGHDAVIKGFTESVQRGRLGHAYLFTGPVVIGKRLTALELARALLCEKLRPQQFEACDQCPACQQILADTHPDVLLAGLPEGAHEWPIELMREILGRFALKPARGKGKVAILDDADDFNPYTANCFLKTLEEPPPGSLLILICTTFERQLPTIVSRCQTVRFAPLSDALVAELLGTRGVTDPVMRQRLVRLSSGSPGQGVALADPALWEFRSNLLTGLTGARIESVALAKLWIEFAQSAGKEGASQRQRSKLVLRLLIDVFNEVLRCLAGGSPHLDDPNEKGILDSLIQRTDVDRILAILDRCLQADEQLSRTVPLVLILESLVDAVAEKLQG